MKLTSGLTALCLMAVVACSSASVAPAAPSAPVPGASQGAGTVGNVRITRVRTFIRDGRPQAFVEGEIGDGCNSLQPVTERRTGSTVTVDVTYRRQGDICTMLMQLLNQWVPLSGTFAAGDYTLKVNDITQSFRLVSSSSGLRVEPDQGPMPQPPYGPPVTVEPSALPTK